MCSSKLTGQIGNHQFAQRSFEIAQVAKKGGTCTLTSTELHAPSPASPAWFTPDFTWSRYCDHWLHVVCRLSSTFILSVQHVTSHWARSLSLSWHVCWQYMTHHIMNCSTWCVILLTLYSLILSVMTHTVVPLYRMVRLHLIEWEKENLMKIIHQDMMK